MLKERLSQKELPHQRFAGRNVAVRLDPRPSDRYELRTRDSLGDPLVEIRVAFLYPRVLLSLRAGELVLRINIHVRGLGTESSYALAVSLGEWPEPGGVDVSMSDRGELVAVVAVGLCVDRREDLAGLGPGVPIVCTPDVAEAIELV